MAQEKPGQTLSPTALVHEAYLRLVGDQQFEIAGTSSQPQRRRCGESSWKRCGGEVALELAGDGHASISTVRLPLRRNGTTNCSPWTQRLSDSRSSNPRHAQLVQLRYFAGCTMKLGGRPTAHAVADAQTAFGPMPRLGCCGIFGPISIFAKILAHFVRLISHCGIRRINAMNERELFEAALEQAPAERARFLDVAGAGPKHAPPRLDLESNLGRHAEAESFLENPAVPVDLTGACRSVAEGPGSVIGSYKLLQQIGEGGMGVCRWRNSRSRFAARLR